ncbi:Uncharacterized membrane protein [Sphingomonas laterariae]|uniref:Uncharacterized membrane protein n=1 Tax=Edaphosphingomonas laterariae TaxID=861865 RepID=A0A239G378_9SPHN|nr:DUF969 domain-containing protein [Sphingomonas laterariae]SNS63530.1 Uncharacterized membrane protein [Sphingomonas laterariae]
MLVLSGIAVVILGFALRFNPLLVVITAGLVTALAAGLDPVAAIAAIGKAFRDNRFIAIPWLVLPVIGLIERGGIRERARTLITRIRGATTGRVLIAYFTVRQITAALGLISLGGHVQMVRPLIAPMAEATAERDAPIDPDTRHHIRAHAAAADNVAVFFGEDVFIAIGSILLIRGVLEQHGIFVQPLQLAVWAIPTAIAAFLIHNARLLLLDRRLRARVGAEA